ncbi:MAG TPA: peptidoglycan DD-metalloendopeptidase family protein [Actinomycetaceae bacterium]|nr:peptidoglycan DD-metalloendopeptidase family protein [Actinomycetaceae bacterium]
MRRRRPLAFLTVMLAASLGLVAPAVADERDELAGQLSQNESKIETLQSQLEGVDLSLQQTYLELEATRTQIPIAQAELVQAEESLAAAVRIQQSVADRLAVAENELVGIEDVLVASREQIAESHDSLGALARATYQSGGATTQDPMALLLGSESTDDFLTQYTALDSAVRSQTTVLDEMSELEATQRNAEARQESVLVRIEELKVEADQAVDEADQARSVAAAKRQELANLEVQQASLAGDLEGQRGSIEAQQANLASANSDLQTRIAAIDEANRRAEEERKRREAEEQRQRDEEAQRQREAAVEAQRQREAGANPAPAPAAPAPKPAAPAPAPAQSASYAFLPPVPQPLYVTSPYGYRIYPITGGWFMHYGVDLRSACGNRQMAVAGGTISDVRGAYGNGTHGNQIIINHGMINGSSYVSVYNHLSSFAVSRGQSVSQGQTIGYTGATGNVTGCHVHLEIWKNGSTIDPMTLPAF